MGYGAVWAGGSPDADLSFVEPILDATESLQIATGIVNIWKSPADQVAESYHRIEHAHPGRFLLGIGVGHPEAIDRYRKPYEALVEYLDELDAAAVPTSRRVIAALGPRVLQLSKDRSAGAHPYLTTPEHTAQARQLIGPTTFLAPEHKVVLTTDTDHAREIGRQTVGFYLGLSNYVSNWRRLGFSEHDVTKSRQRRPHRLGRRLWHAPPDRCTSPRAPRRRRRSRRHPGTRRPRGARAHPQRTGRSIRPHTSELTTSRRSASRGMFEAPPGKQRPLGPQETQWPLE